MLSIISTAASNDSSCNLVNSSVALMLRRLSSDGVSSNELDSSSSDDDTDKSDNPPHMLLLSQLLALKSLCDGHPSFPSSDVSISGFNKYVGCVPGYAKPVNCDLAAPMALNALDRGTSLPLDGGREMNA